MKRCCLPDGAGVHTVVEEHDQRASPVATDGIWIAPTSGAVHFVSCKVDRVELRLGQVVPAGHVSVRLELREPWQGVDNVLLPCPRHDCSQMGTNLVRGPPGIPSFPISSILVDPIQKLTDFFASEPVKRESASPVRRQLVLPFSDN